MFADRRDAGRQLAQRIRQLRGPDVVVLGLPQGGVPVAAEVAAGLDAPLDVLVVRELGVPGRPGQTMGAVGEGGVRVVNRQVLHLAGVSSATLATAERVEREALRHQTAALRQGRPPMPLAGHTAVIVDDGLTTGESAQAACQMARLRGASRAIIAVPVAAAETVERLSHIADEVVCLDRRPSLGKVSEAYDDFSPVGDDEVGVALERAARQTAGPRPVRRFMTIDADGAVLQADVFVPAQPKGAVIFAHGSSSSRYSPGNVFTARMFNDAGFATVLLDLLTPAEDLAHAPAADLELLAARLTAATRWVRRQGWATAAPIGWFAAGVSAAAALSAAAAPNADVDAIVSWDGRLEISGERLSGVRAPTLLIAGGVDTRVLDLNRVAHSRLRCPSLLSIVPGAVHLLAETDIRDSAAEQACDWFRRHLRPPAPPPAGTSLSTLRGR